MIKQKTFETEIEINDFVSNTQNISIISIETQKYDKTYYDEFNRWTVEEIQFNVWYTDNN